MSRLAYFCTPYIPIIVAIEAINDTTVQLSFKNTTPAKTETTAQRFEKTTVLATGMWAAAKFKSKNAATDESTERYKTLAKNDRS